MKEQLKTVSSTSGLTSTLPKPLNRNTANAPSKIISVRAKSLIHDFPMPPSRNKNLVASDKQQMERNKDIKASKHEEKKGTRILNRTNSSKNDSSDKTKATNPHKPRIVGKKNE